MLVTRKGFPHLVGIMQGRLTPPKGRGIQFFPFEEWEEEFEKAAKLGLDEIEFICDLDRYQDNPLWYAGGIWRINELKERYGLTISHICADFFMRRPFFRVEEKVRQENVKVLERLVFQASKIGARSVEIPLLDNSSLKSEEEEELLVRSIEECLWLAVGLNVTISLETDLPPIRFRQLLERFDNQLVGAVYDSGNSASLGYFPYEEITVLGDLVSNIHIKDRMLGGGTVPLGTGSADFFGLFKGLREVGYKGSFIFQAARGPDGQEVENIRQQMSFLRDLTSAFLKPDGKK